MNITRENIGELELLIKVEIEANDYQEKVTKKLKSYRQSATIPGFRKGMAPMGLIQKYYKTSVTADEVQNTLNDALYKYIVDEKLDLIGTPLSNDGKTGEIDFEKGTDFTFYFDAATFPHMELAWDKLEAKLYQVKVGAKDVEEQISSMQRNYGKFEVPTELALDEDAVYARYFELEKGERKEGATEKFVTFPMSKIKDEKIKAMFMGKKEKDVVTFNVGKAFSTSDIEYLFHLDNEAAKKYKIDIELSISSLARITPHEINEEFFKTVFPTEDITAEDQFKKRVKKSLEESYEEQCRMLYVNEVEKWFLDNFNTTLPTEFLQRYVAERGSKETTLDEVVSTWETAYLPSIKIEILEESLSKEGNINPAKADVVNEVVRILKERDTKNGEETEEAYEKRINDMAEEIAKDRKNVEQIYGRLRGAMMFKLFNEKAKPETEKITTKEFAEKARM